MRRLAKLGALSAALVLASAVPAAAAITKYRVGDTGFLTDGTSAKPSARDVKWYREGTTAGSAVTVSRDFGSPAEPAGDGALKLTTNNSASAVAELFTNHVVYGTPLSEQTDLYYYTYQSSTTPNADALPALELRVDIDGNLSTTSDVTTLVYDPKDNEEDGPAPQQPIEPDTWQLWMTIGGWWWPTNRIDCGAYVVEAGPGGTVSAAPDEVNNNCSDATVLAIGVRIAPGNPSTTAGVDWIEYDTVANVQHVWDFGPK